jgi:hypothetical protein
MGGTGSGRKRKQPDTLLNSGSIAYFWAPDRAAASVNVEAKNATADKQPPSEAGEVTSRVAELVAEQQAADVLFSDAVGDEEEIAPKQKRRNLADVLAQGEMRYFEHAENSRMRCAVCSILRPEIGQRYYDCVMPALASRLEQHVRAAQHLKRVKLRENPGAEGEPRLIEC